MINAKEELKSLLGEVRLKLECANIYIQTYNDETYDYDKKHFILKIGHDLNDYVSFINSLDFNYDDGFGWQELYGNLWFEDGSWAERYEYDGSECWEHKIKPDKPYFLFN
jgi:hypothetical protein